MNNGTYIVNLGRDPEQLELGGRTVYKLRVAEKAGGKRAITRWFNALVGGPDTETASHLKSGDAIALAGELVLTEYTPSKGKFKGQVQREDEMPFARILRVLKSESFFAYLSGGNGGDDGGSAPSAEAGTPPEDDLPF